MGEIMAKITAKELAKNQRVTIDAIRVRWNEVFREIPFDRNAELTAEQIQELSRKRTRKPKARVREILPIVLPAAEAETPPAHTPRAVRFRWPAFGLSEFLAVAIYGHTILVWYEVAVIFGVPGILAGVVVFALKHAAVTICRSGKFQDYVTDVLGVAFILDLLAVWAHHAAFADAMPERFAADDGNIAAWILGLVVAAGAFLSLYFTEKTANKDV